MQPNLINTELNGMTSDDLHFFSADCIIGDRTVSAASFEELDFLKKDPRQD